MRTLINSTYVTLDGVSANPHLWPALPDPSDSEDLSTGLLLTCDAVLMGRRTYDGFATVFPSRIGRFEERINTMPKYVASRTLIDPKWTNTTVIGEDLIGSVRRLKEQPGGPIVQYGVGEVTAQLMRHGLVDEFRLWIHPQFVGGTATDLVFHGCPDVGLDLTRTTVLPNGIVLLSFRVSGPGGVQEGT